MTTKPLCTISEQNTQNVMSILSVISAKITEETGNIWSDEMISHLCEMNGKRKALT